MKIFVLLTILLIVLINAIQSKHHSHKYSCPVLQKCPTHKHKVCGSDGKLYNSRCHLRKVACMSNNNLRAAHPDQCTKDEDEEEDKSQNEDKDSQEECKPKQYDLMKEELLLKTSDLSLLFTHLDENGDGEINVNELWKHSSIYKPEDSVCLLTDLLLHEDSNRDENLDFAEFQNAFNKLYSITMVTLDQSLAVNTVQAHIGDNVEIRCDIVGEPQPPAIKWTRYNVDLSSVNIPNMKVFSDGSLYLTNVQLSFSGNYTCQAVNNPVVKQVHILHTIVPPLVQVSPRFQWEPIGGMATMECKYETFEDSITVEWFKNDEMLLSNQRTTLMNNNTKVQIGQLERTDTGAYSCRVSDKKDTAVGQDVSSLLIQDEAVAISSIDSDKERLWVFHGNGVSIYSGGCEGLLHELDGRDILPQSGLTLCGGTDPEQHVICEWSDNAIVANSKIYIGQPNLNRIVVFHSIQLNVVQVIATDPQPKKLWSVQSGVDEQQIWVLCFGNSVDMKADDESKHDSFGDFEERKQGDSVEFDWSYPSQQQQHYNRKTVQVIRLSANVHQPNVIHLQPIDGHFDLVYDLFIPSYSPQRLHQQHGITNRYAHVTHWDERAIIKIDMSQFKYMKTINLADCQPINGIHTDHGLLIIQCQTPITHQLNGQLVVDQITDALIAYNVHVKAQKSYLSPNQHFLVNVLHNSSIPTATTIIVQRVTRTGLEFLYDVRTSLDIVNCEFVWKNGNYDAILASGTANREDLLYLSLSDGRVELITGIGRPTSGSHRGLALANKSRLLAVTATESVYLVDLNTNRIQCETMQRHQKPNTLIWS
jgi:hypothetical protein